MTRLIRLIKKHENAQLARGNTKAGMPHWDKTGQRLYRGLEQVVGESVYAERIVGFGDEPEIREQLGHLTAGYGSNLEVEWPEAFWNHVLQWPLGQAHQVALSYGWFGSLGTGARTLETFLNLCTPRQAVVISMIYQLGPRGFAGFKRMIKNLHRAVAIPEDFDKHLPAEKHEELRKWAFMGAADEMLDSEWARRTPTRAKELSKMMRTGEWPTWLREAAQSRAALAG